MAECRNFFDDAATPLRRSTSFPVTDEDDGCSRRRDDTSIELNLSLSLGSVAGSGTGASVSGKLSCKQASLCNNQHGHELVRSQIPVYPSIDKQRSGNFASDVVLRSHSEQINYVEQRRHGEQRNNFEQNNHSEHRNYVEQKCHTEQRSLVEQRNHDEQRNYGDAGSIMRNHGEAGSGHSGEKNMYPSSNASGFGLPSRDQVWQNLLRNGTVFGPPTTETSDAAAAAAGAWAARRATSVQIVMPFKDMNEPMSHPIRRSCSNDVVQLPSRQISGLDCVSIDLRNTSLHQEALELQKRKEMQAQRRLEARKRRRMRTLAEEKLQKKARQNSCGSLQRMNSKPCGSPNEKFGEETSPLASVAADEGKQSENKNSMDEKGATAMSSDSASHGSSDSNMQVDHHRNNGFNEHDASPNRKDLKTRSPDKARSLDSTDAKDHNSEQAPPICKDVTISNNKVGNCVNGARNSSPLATTSYAYNGQGSQSATGNSAMQTNLSLSPFKNYPGAESGGSHLWHPTAGKAQQLGMGSLPNSSSSRDSNSDGRWRDNNSGEKSAFLSVRRTTSNGGQVFTEHHTDGTRPLESPASVSSQPSQLNITRTMSYIPIDSSRDNENKQTSMNITRTMSYIPIDSRGNDNKQALMNITRTMSYIPKDNRENEKQNITRTMSYIPVEIDKQSSNGSGDGNAKFPIERQQSWPVARTQEMNGTKTNFGSMTASSFLQLKQSNGSFSDLSSMGRGLPMVTTTGRGPNGRTISGVMYITDGRQVRLICNCHNKHMTPTEFVEHSGSTDLSHPERSIVVNSLPFLSQLASTPV